MKTYLRDFLGAEDGAVTVDWVVLTAAIVGLAFVAYANIEGGVETLGGNIEDALGAVLPNAGL